MQLVGSWLRHPAFAILLPVPLFVLGHGYDVWGAASVGLFAVVAAWLTWRTGGLEAAISLHIVNNLLIFLLGSVAVVDANATSARPSISSAPRWRCSSSPSSPTAGPAAGASSGPQRSPTAPRARISSRGCCAAERRHRRQAAIASASMIV